MVVGTIPTAGDQILLCRRAIEPRYGMWTLPAGFLETGETVLQGALRETHEEACATLSAVHPYAMYNITFVNQIYFMFRGELVDGVFAPGAESLEVRLFGIQEIPWQEIAFEVIRVTLTNYLADYQQGIFAFHMDDIAVPPHLRKAHNPSADNP
jgi:ADP-ribose pyrophosphatase YjhB (NUDIX family)